MFRRKKKESTVERKERSDKKREVKATVSIKLKQEIERLGDITDNPVKFIGEVLCYEGIHTPEVIALLAPYFQRRTILVDRSAYFGSEENASLRDRTDSDQTDRVSIRFTKTNYEDIRLLADALDVTPSRATSILLDASIRYPAIIETILLEYNTRNSHDDDYAGEIRKLMRFINRDNPFKNKTWNKSIEDIVKDVKRTVSTVKKTIKQLNYKATDTESYKWNLDQELLPGKVPPEVRRRKLIN